MAIDPLTYKPKGDKENSEFFETYKVKIYERRKSSGLEDLLDTLRALVVQVEHGDAFSYLRELYLMGPYRFAAAFQNETHRIFVLESHPDYPRFIVLEPLSPDYVDDITMRNRLYPLSAAKANARYVGEIFQTQDVDATRKILESHNIRFNYHHETKNAFFTDAQIAFTFPSDYTSNRVGYSEIDIADYGALQLGEPIEIPAEEKKPGRKAKLEVKLSKIRLRGGGNILPIRLWAICAREIDCPGRDRVDWLLATTIPTNSFKDAQRFLKWHLMRMRRNLCHEALENICPVDDPGIDDVASLKTCLGIYMVIAWRICLMKFLGRKTPGSLLHISFSNPEWKVSGMRAVHVLRIFADAALNDPGTPFIIAGTRSAKMSAGDPHMKRAGPCRSHDP